MTSSSLRSRFSIPSGQWRGSPTCVALPGTTCTERLNPPVKIVATLPSTFRIGAYRADGRMIALADDDGSTFLLDLDTDSLRELPGKRKFTLCWTLLFSRDGRTLASHSSNRNDSVTEVRLWDVASGTAIAGMPESMIHCCEIVFSPDGGTLVTVQRVVNNPEPPVRSWKLSADRKSVTLHEALRGDELKDRLSHRRPSNRRASGPFQLSDVLSMTDDGASLAVWLEGGQIGVRTTGTAHSKAICRVAGPEVVFIPRTNQTVPVRQAAIDELGRIARELTGCARTGQSVKTSPSGGGNSPRMVARRPFR